MGGAYKVKKLAARDSHFLLNNFLIKHFGVRNINSYKYLYIAIVSDFFENLNCVFLCFWLIFWSTSCFKSSGRLLGTISTKFRPNPTSSDPGSWENSITFSQLKIWRSCTPPYDLILGRPGGGLGGPGGGF